MTNEQFETLKLSIETLTDELEMLQHMYIRETGQRYIPPVKFNREDLINDCMQWNEDKKYYKPLKGK
jgi:hypothetical protein